MRPTLQRRVFWHRELPPVEQEPDGEHVLEARSDAVPYRHGEDAALHRACEASLRAHAEERLVAELDRLGGSTAHVTDETIEARRDHAAGTFALLGTYTFVVYRAPRA